VLNENFVWLGLFVGGLGSVSYVWATLKGRVKPNRLSFIILALAPLVAFAAEIDQGVGLRSAVTLWVGLSPLLIFLASFVNKDAYWKLRPLDVFCGLLAVTALILWSLTGSGNVAIALAVAADGFAVLPILVKAWRFPHTESPWLFVGAMVNAGIALLVLDRWTFADYAFPAYLFGFATVLVAVIVVRQRPKPAGTPG